MLGLFFGRCVGILFITSCGFSVQSRAETQSNMQHSLVSPEVDESQKLQTEATDPRITDLLKLLKTPVPDYQPTRVSDVIKPQTKIKTFEVSWVNAPQYVLNAQDMKGFQRPVKMKLTVIAATSYIGESLILQSSGSKRADEKIQKALQVARLDPIPMVDKNLSYRVEHDFAINPPQ